MSRAPAVCALAAAALCAGAIAAEPVAAAQAPERQKGILIALLVPFADQTERGTVQVTARGSSVSVSGVWASLTVGQRYGLALSRRPCREVQRDRGRPALIGGVFGEFTAKASSVRDTTRSEAGDRVRTARSLLLMGDFNADGTVDAADYVTACGAASAFTARPSTTAIGSLAALDPVGESGVSALASAHETPGRLDLRASVTCEAQERCQRIMEEEGIFYFARAPCGRPAAATGTYTLTIGPSVASLVLGNVLTFRDVLTTSVRRPAAAVTRRARSLRLRLGDEDIACGRLYPSGTVTF